MLFSTPPDSRMPAAAFPSKLGPFNCHSSNVAHFVRHSSYSRRMRELKSGALAHASSLTSSSTASPSVTTQQTEHLPEEKFTEAEWKSFLSGFASTYEEHQRFIYPNDIQGEIPTELRGTFLRNGPGIFEIGDKQIPQPFDGDGLVAALSFPGDGKPPFFANRLVRTQAMVEEQQAGRMLYRGAFSVGNPAGGLFYNPFDLSVKKIANTGVVHWANRIMALYERDMPYELTGPDLRTKGQTDCGGAISEGPYFAAHYRIVNQPDGSRRLIGFNSRETGMSNDITVWELDEEGRQLHKSDFTLPDAAFGFFHDLAVTDESYIFVENPVRLDLVKMLTRYMFGRACLAECLVFDVSRPTKIHVIPRPRPHHGSNQATRATYAAPTPFFTFHHGNAYVAPDGRIVLDTVGYPEGFDFNANLQTASVKYYDDNVGRGALMRLVITPSTGRVAQHRLMTRACEFPSVAPSAVARPHRHVYLIGAKSPGADTWGAPQVIVKATIDPEAGVGRGIVGDGRVEQKVYWPGPRRWPGEPMFVPRQTPTSSGDASSAHQQHDEDDGWVLTVVYDEELQRSEVVILNAKDLTEVATVRLPVKLPSGLHGSWTKEYLGADASHAEDFAPRSYDIRRGGPLRYE